MKYWFAYGFSSTRAFKIKDFRFCLKCEARTVELLRYRKSRAEWLPTLLNSACAKNFFHFLQKSPDQSTNNVWTITPQPHLGSGTMAVSCEDAGELIIK